MVLEATATRKAAPGKCELLPRATPCMGFFPLNVPEELRTAGRLPHCFPNTTCSLQAASCTHICHFWSFFWPPPASQGVVSPRGIREHAAEAAHGARTPPAFASQGSAAAQPVSKVSEEGEVPRRGREGGGGMPRIDFMSALT